MTKCDPKRLRTQKSDTSPEPVLTTSSIPQFQNTHILGTWTLRVDRVEGLGFGKFEDLGCKLGAEAL